MRLKELLWKTVKVFFFHCKMLAPFTGDFRDIGPVNLTLLTIAKKTMQI